MPLAESLICSKPCNWSGIKKLKSWLLLTLNPETFGVAQLDCSKCLDKLASDEVVADSFDVVQIIGIWYFETME